MFRPRNRWFDMFHQDGDDRLMTWACAIAFRSFSELAKKLYQITKFSGRDAIKLS